MWLCPNDPSPPSPSPPAHPAPSTLCFLTMTQPNPAPTQHLAPAGLTVLPFTMWDTYRWASIPVCGLVGFLLLGELGMEGGSSQQSS